MVSSLCSTHASASPAHGGFAPRLHTNTTTVTAPETLQHHNTKLSPLVSHSLPWLQSHPVRSRIQPWPGSRCCSVWGWSRSPSGRQTGYAGRHNYRSSCCHWRHAPACLRSRQLHCWRGGAQEVGNEKRRPSATVDVSIQCTVTIRLYVSNCPDIHSSNRSSPSVHNSSLILISVKSTCFNVPRKVTTIHKSLLPCTCYLWVSELILRFYCWFLKPWTVRLQPLSANCDPPPWAGSLPEILQQLFQNNWLLLIGPLSCGTPCLENSITQTQYLIFNNFLRLFYYMACSYL